MNSISPYNVLSNKIILSTSSQVGFIPVATRSEDEYKLLTYLQQLGE